MNVSSAQGTLKNYDKKGTEALGNKSSDEKDGPDGEENKKWFKLLVRFLLLYWRSLVVILVPLLFLPIPIINNTKEARCAYVIIIMAFYWMTEAIPLPVTSLIPVALFPLLGVLSSEAVCIAYLKETNMMFVGGLTVAIAVEHSNLHERIGLKALLIVGTSPRLLMLGFMLTSMFLSMWIANTAATAMMGPIVLVVLRELEEAKKLRASLAMLYNTENAAEEGKSSAQKKVEVSKEQAQLEDENRMLATNESIGYFLGVAYASNIGGTGTVIGTGTNLLFMGIFESFFPKATELNFASWMLVNVPGMLINTLLAWVILQVTFFKLFRGGNDYGGPEAARKIRIVIQNRYEQLGPMTFHEIIVLTLFVILIILWFFRSPQFIPGWADFLADVAIKDATPAILIIVFMFILPEKNDMFRWLFKNGRRPEKNSPAALVWKVVQKKLPWGIILLLGGGFAMAKGCNESGLSRLMGKQLSIVDALPPWLVVTLTCVAISLITELTSNTAVANIFLPILGEMSKITRQNPIYLMMPAAICASYAFMLPVGTPPNAIVYGISKMRTIEMIKGGFVLNFVSVFVIIIQINTIGRLVFDLSTYPAWAEDDDTQNVLE